jgi:hypothetical protein
VDERFFHWLTSEWAKVASDNMIEVYCSSVPDVASLFFTNLSNEPIDYAMILYSSWDALQEALFLL